MINREMVKSNYIWFEDTGQAFQIPGTPEEIPETNNANWSTTNILGRGSPIYVYQGGGDRSFTFSFDLHRDMAEEFGYDIDSLVSAIKSSTYPISAGSYIMPPIIAIRFYDIYLDNAICISNNIVYKLPVVDNKYQLYSISMSVNAAPLNPYTANYFRVSGFLNTGTMP